MKRRSPLSANAASPRKPRSEAGPLSICPVCHRDFVAPVDWEPVNDDRWRIYIRCGECGTAREVTVNNYVAARYDEELSRAHKAIARAAQKLQKERLAAEVESFVAALRHDLIDAGDFAR